MIRSHKFVFATIPVVVLVAAALAVFGSSPSTGSAKADRGKVNLAAVTTQLQKPQHLPPHAGGYIVGSRDQITTTTKKPSVATYPTGMDTDEVSATGAKPQPPCTLVPRSDAAAILGGPVTTSVAPQGPTCVYSTPGSKQDLTVAVEDSRLPALRKQAHDVTPVDIAGHDGWCMHYGSTSVGVALPGGAMLHVTGPCSSASRFSTVAMNRLDGNS